MTRDDPLHQRRISDGLWQQQRTSSASSSTSSSSSTTAASTSAKPSYCAALSNLRGLGQGHPQH